MNDKFVVFFDRGMIDGKAYLSKREWEILKNEVDITDAEIFERYDLVLHLVSAAEGAEEYYQWNDPDVDEVGNNEVRSESPEEARIQEIKNKDAYLGFPYIYYFGNETNFDEKVNKVVGTVMSSIGMGKPILGSKKRYLVSKIDKKDT